MAIGIVVEVLSNGVHKILFEFCVRCIGVGIADFWSGVDLLIIVHYLLFLYLFSVKSLFTIKYKYYTIIIKYSTYKSHSQELGLLKPIYILVASARSMKYHLTLC